MQTSEVEIPSPVPSPAGGWRQRLDRLFATGTSTSTLRWWWGGLAVLVAAAVSLGRTGGPGPFNSIWAEDGSDFLTDAWNRGTWDAITRPLNGYFVVVPRLLAEVASLVPPQWAPAVLSVEAALVTGLMALAVYVVSGAHLPSVVARLVAAVPVVVAPVGDNLSATVANNVATLQFGATYLTLWLLLYSAPTRLGRVMTVLAVVAAASTTLLTAIFLPLALLRLAVRRDRLSAALAGVLVLAASANIVALATGLTTRPTVSSPRPDPIWALRSVGSWGLREVVLGDRVANAYATPVLGNWGATGLAALILLAAVVVAARHLTRPLWMLAAVLGGHALAYACLTIMSHGRIEVRYLIGPELMVYAALAALLIPLSAGGSVWRRQAPMIALAALVGILCLLNYRSPTARTVSVPWQGLVAQARAYCQDPAYDGVWVYPNYQGLLQPVRPGVTAPDFKYGFPSRIPCSRLR